ncbi:MAG: hypothetical protein ACJ796_09425 [Gemmatimonadaceae bacterium]
MAFGGILRSEMEFPELRPASQALMADWTFSVEQGLPPDRAAVLIGERAIREEKYRLWRTETGLQLQYSHAGTFDISRGGRHIVWYQDETAALELVRSIVIGPALALALELAGFFCLHGSAVTVDGKAISFIGPKFYGKSTLATALTAAGARLVGDDLLVVRPGPPATLRPGVASVRLWPDMAATLSLTDVCNTLIPGVKTTATGFTREALALVSSPLTTVYVLAPVASASAAGTLCRTRLSPTEATIALAHHTKLADSLVGVEGARSHLAMAAVVATGVPAWTLHIARDARRLSEVVQQIIQWSCAE